MKIKTVEKLTRGLLRGLDERPVEAPLTDRDLAKHQDMLVNRVFMLQDITDTQCFSVC